MPKLVDLYNINEDNQHDKPLQSWTRLKNPSNPLYETNARATIDGGAMLCVMDCTFWASIEGAIGPLAKSSILCRMADGSLTSSLGRGEALLGLAGQWQKIRFEVLDARGNYDILLGKPWLRLVGASQVFKGDTLILTTPNGPLELHNNYPLPATPPIEPEMPTEPQGEVKSEKPAPEPEKAASVEPGEPIPVPVPAPDIAPVPVPARRSRRLQKLQPELKNNPFWVDSASIERLEQWTGMSTRNKEPNHEPVRTPEARSMGSQAPGPREESEDELLDRLWRLAWTRVEERTQRDILLTEAVDRDSRVRHLDAILDRAQRSIERARGPADLMALNTSSEEDRQFRHPSAQRRVQVPPIATSLRKSDPFEPLRVKEILRKIGIGSDLTEQQKRAVQDLVSEFADIFALNLSEVLPIDFAEIKLDIPENTSFPKRASQKRLTEPQRQWLYRTLDDMEEARVIMKVTQDQVAAVSPTNIVPKPGGAELPSIAALRKMANDQCLKYGLPIMWPEEETEEPVENATAPEAKFRLVHNFASVNRVTQLRPFPMGDLAAMQRKIAGHRWVSVMDFMAGFNAIPVAPESVPYTGFHVDGRGYYVYLRMPFGLTGAPTTFCETLAAAFHDLVGKDLEVWMDDVASACDDFEDGMSKLRAIFAKCRSHGLSLAPAKTVLFMSEAKFAGARCSAEGIRPDLSKVKAILDWPEPRTALEVMSFLGCVGSYRTKIKNYARIAQPLSDLTRDIRPPQVGTSTNKQEYKRALKETQIKLSDEARQAFITLKTVLTSDTLTRAPVYDGRPFVVTTDGSKFGFGAVLSQEWEVSDGPGRTRKVMYPVAFASKRTSRTEERYIPFLLEFAALKYALDEFDSIIYGQPIELETDCKALADLLGNNKLNSTHERWRESIVARDIRAVRHKPGADNRVCDALSRIYESRPDDNTHAGQDFSVDPGWEAAKGVLNDVYLLVNDGPSRALLVRFIDDPYFTEILNHLLFDTGEVDNEASEDQRARKRRAHRAEGFMVEDGKLWLVGGKRSKRSGKVECIPRREAKELALAVHSAGGHFGRDMTILALQQKFFWPDLRKDTIEAITSCPRCKNFGPRLLSAQMQPITRSRPFDLLVGDYLSLPVGHGGFKNVLVLVDAYSRFAFAFPLRGPGTGKTTVDLLSRVTDMILTPRAFMADGGSHFDCEEVKTWAESRGVTIIKTPAYAPWTNGLVEGYNKLLIGRLKHLCTPTVGESPEEDGDPATTPGAWPKHLATAVAQLNDRTLPSLSYTPRELMTGQISAERRAKLSATIREPSSLEVEINMALTYSLRQDAYALALEHAERRRKSSDKHARIANFKPGDLVQRYDARWDETHAAARKLVPRWSGPLRIVSRSLNSYALEDLHGKRFSEATHTRLLRPFIPRAGTPLADYALALEQARSANPAASKPIVETPVALLPATQRPEIRLPLLREDATQPPNNYQVDLSS